MKRILFISLVFILIILPSYHPVRTISFSTPSQGRVPTSHGEMLIYLPVTGNYETIYPWGTLGQLPMQIAWQNPEDDYGLNHLENVHIRRRFENRMVQC